MIYEIIFGSLIMACLTAMLFFFRFWQKSGERLFLIFSASFFVMAVERGVLGYLGTANEPSPKIYLLRLSSFLIILFGILDKNRRKVS